MLFLYSNYLVHKISGDSKQNKLRSVSFNNFGKSVTTALTIERYTPKSIIKMQLSKKIHEIHRVNSLEVVRLQNLCCTHIDICQNSQIVFGISQNM